MEGDAVVLHGHVRKRDQSSFSLQAQLFFLLPPRYRLGHLRSCHWHSRLITSKVARRLPPSLPRDCHVPNTHASQLVGQSHHIVPASNLRVTVKNLVPYPFPSCLAHLPFLAPRPMPATAGKSDLKKKLKQAASEAVRQPDCFNLLSTCVLCSLYLLYLPSVPGTQARSPIIYLGIYLGICSSRRTVSSPYMKRGNVQLGPIHSFQTHKPMA